MPPLQWSLCSAHLRMCMICNYSLRDTWVFLQAHVTVVGAECDPNTHMVTAPPYLRVHMADKNAK